MSTYNLFVTLDVTLGTVMCVHENGVTWRAPALPLPQLRAGQRRGAVNQALRSQAACASSQLSWDGLIVNLMSLLTIVDVTVVCVFVFKWGL